MDLTSYQTAGRLISARKQIEDDLKILAEQVTCLRNLHQIGMDISPELFQTFKASVEAELNDKLSLIDNQFRAL